MLSSFSTQQSHASLVQRLLFLISFVFPFVSAWGIDPSCQSYNGQDLTSRIEEAMLDASNMVDYASNQIANRRNSKDTLRATLFGGGLGNSARYNGHAERFDSWATKLDSWGGASGSDVRSTNRTAEQARSDLVNDRLTVFCGDSSFQWDKTTELFKLPSYENTYVSFDDAPTHGYERLCFNNFATMFNAESIGTAEGYTDESFEHVNFLIFCGLDDMSNTGVSDITKSLAPAAGQYSEASVYPGKSVDQVFDNTLSLVMMHEMFHATQIHSFTPYSHRSHAAEAYKYADCVALVQSQTPSGSDLAPTSQLLQSSEAFYNINNFTNYALIAYLESFFKSSSSDWNKWSIIDGRFADNRMRGSSKTRWTFTVQSTV